MKRLGFFIAFYFSYTLLIAQTWWIKGQLFDENNQAVPFAAIGNLHLSRYAIADSNGVFIIQASKGDSLMISSIGFETNFQVVESEKPIRVMLRTKIYGLNLVTYGELKAINMIKAAIRQIPKNYPMKSYTYKAFYRQLHNENNRFVRLIEADISVLDKGYFSEERIQVNEMRRSKVYERNKDIHGDHLSELLEENTVHYPSRFFTNPFNLGRYAFHFDTTFQSDTLVRILFTQSTSGEPKKLKGYLNISLKDTAIVETYIHSSPNPNYVSRESNQSNWHFRDGAVKVTYQKFGEKYFLHSIGFYYLHEIYNSVFKTYDFKVKEEFTLWVYSYDFIPLPVEKDNFHVLSNLYRRQYDYHPGFWKNYPMLEKHPLEKIQMEDLEREEKLDSQFLNN